VSVLPRNLLPIPRPALGSVFGSVVERVVVVVVVLVLASVPASVRPRRRGEGYAR